jgi:hypothetical protein
MKKIGAWTAPHGSYPPYVNITFEDDEAIVTVREAPVEYEGVYVCGFKGRDDHSPGRCVPDGPACNNYCNMAPEKGPMQDHPLPCRHVKSGQTVVVRMPLVEFQAMMENLK